MLREMDELRLENHRLRDEVSDLRRRVKLGYYHDASPWDETL